MNKSMQDLSVKNEEDEAKEKAYFKEVGDVLDNIGQQLFGRGNYVIQYDYGNAQSIDLQRIVLAQRKERRIFNFFSISYNEDIVYSAPIGKTNGCTLKTPNIVPLFPKHSNV